MPNKNILPLAGHPLIAYSIAAALQMEEVMKVICSTDSKKIAQIAMEYGASVPFLRPKELAADNSRDFETFFHCLVWLKETEGFIPDLVLNLRPTSPVRYLEDIRKAIAIISDSTQIDSVRSVSEPYTTPYKMWKMDFDGQIKPLLVLEGMTEPFNSARQELPEVWAQTGSVEVIRESTISKKNSMSGNNIFGLKVDPHSFIDIDSQRSLDFANFLMPNLQCIKPSK